MSDNRTDLPGPNAPNFNQRLRETIQTYLGRQGNPLDRGLTLRDLIETGVLKIREGFQLKPGAGSNIPLQPGDGVVDVYEPDLTPPPTPSGFTATAAISNLIVEHDAPLYTQGHGHLRTRLYGKIVNAGDPLPTFEDAAEIAQFSGTVHAQPTNPATTWRLWIKWETVDGVLSADPAGGTNGLEVTTGQDVALLLDALTGQITEGQLYQTLQGRIDLIDGPDTLSGSVAARIKTEQTARESADSSIASNITTVQAVANAKNRVYRQTTAPTGTLTDGDLWFDSDDGNKPYRWNGSAWVETSDTRIAANAAAIQNETTARADADSANATTIQQVQARLDTGDYAAVKVESSATASKVTGLEAKYTIKIDVAGHVSGYGLLSTANTGTPTSQFGVRANQFFVAPPSVSQATAPTTNLYKGYVWVDTSVTPNVTKYYTGSAWETTPRALPFIVQTSATTINGVSVPAGVYMDTAFIRDGTITSAKIGNAAIDDAKIANLSASKITAGSIGVGEFIQSTGYVAGSAGWRINGDGNAEFSNITIRQNSATAGSIFGGLASGYAAGNGFFSGWDATTYKWRVGNPTGARIQWNGSAIEVYNASNQLTISSGGISASYVTGLGTLATQNSVSTSQVTGLGTLATQNSVNWNTQITNIPAFGNFAYLSSITSANISTYIAGAAIGTAYIADASITQAKIGNAAVGSAQIADAAITTAKIGAAQIDTLRLAGRSVTFPQSAYTVGMVSSTSELTLQTLTVSSTGEPALLVFSSYIYCSTKEVLTFNLYRDGSRIYTAGGGANYYQQIGGEQVVCGTVIDQPAAGTHTYTMTIGNSGGTAGLWGSSRCMTYLECKR